MAKELRLTIQTAAFVLTIGVISSFTYAQNVPNNPYEFSIQAGPLLPSRVPLVREILLGTDFRASLPTSKGLFEIDAYLANGDGTSYRSFSFDYRADLGNDVFPAFFTIGAHGDFYTPSDSSYRFVGGWHFGGGMFQPLTSNLALREDFRYRLGPGVSVMIGLGISYQFSN